MSDLPRRLPAVRPRLPARLPPPVHPPYPAAPRSGVRVRPALPTDAVRCTTISTAYTTTHVWQLDARTEGDEVRSVFRLVRLPRELTLDAAVHPPAKAGQRGVLWLVAEEGPRSPVVGYVAAYFRPDEPYTYAYLQALAVDPAARRRGIATRLLDETRRWAAAQGATRLLADVAARNLPALRLLQRAGFAFCGYNDLCYRQDEVAVFLSVETR